jgi:exopolysaccharide biosynthesis polyprenyl glycosylphosphotransferase
MIHVKHLQRRWLFAVLDMGGVGAAVWLALVVRSSIPLPWFQGLLPQSPGLAFVELQSDVMLMAGGFVLIQYVFGVYDLWATSSPIAWLQRLVAPNVMLIACAFAGLYLFQNFNFPRSLLVTAFVLNVAFGLVWRLIYFHGVERSKSQIVLVGGLDHCLKMAREFELPPFAGRVEVTALFILGKGHVRDHSYPVYSLDQFEEYSRENPYTSVIVVPSDLGANNIFGEVLSAAKRGVPVYAMPSAYEILMGRLRHVQVNDLPLLELKLEPPSALFAATKRGMDVILATFLLVGLSPLLAVIAALVRMESHGPALYSQDRVGLGGRTFRVWKFRSMVADAESSTGPVLATKRDSRITRLGRFLRQTRVDELPQLVNILNGDMSFVGPRPERPLFVSQFEREIPGYRERTRIRPGVTGLAQVSGTYESSADIKLKYDLAYMANQSVALDLQILLRTAKTVLLKAGQ